jgi:hypothetical protein
MWPLLARAMHQLDHLLILSFGRHDFDGTGANGFKHGCAISGIGLIATHVGTHLLRREQADPMPW